MADHGWLTDWLCVLCAAPQLGCRAAHSPGVGAAPSLHCMPMAALHPPVLPLPLLAEPAARLAR